MSNTFEISVTIVINSFLGGLNVGDVLRYYFKNYRGAYCSAYTGATIFVVKEVKPLVPRGDVCVASVTLSYITTSDYWFSSFSDIDLGFKYRYNSSHDFLSDFHKIVDF